MPVPFSLASAVSRYTPLAGQAVKRFRQQPTLLSTASELVSRALARLEPPVTSDPGHIALAWPADDQAKAELEYLALPEVLLDLFLRETVLTIVPGYQQLLRNEAGIWVELPVDLRRLAQELDVVRPTLIDSFEEALALFWSEADRQGETHWAWMADYLRESFLHGLVDAQRAGRLPPSAYDAGMAVATWRVGEIVTQRVPSARVGLYLLQIQSRGLGVPFDVRLDPHLLIGFTGSDDVERYLLFSLNADVHFHSTLSGVRAAINATLAGQEGLEGASVQRLSVKGDVFAALARTFLQMQLIQLSGLARWVRTYGTLSGASLLTAASDAVTGFFQLDAKRQEQNARLLRHALPAWLRQAATVDRWHFASALAQLANSWPQIEGSWFLHDIPSLDAYVYQRMREEAAHSHPGGAPLVPEDVELTVGYVLPDNLAVAGGPATPHIVEEPLGLTQLAVDNLAAHAAGWLKVSAKPGKALPRWLNEDSLKALVTAIDVGQHYPELLRRRLLEGPEAAAREALFRQQVTLQLPLLAGELLMRGESGFDRDGYALVEEALGGCTRPGPARLVGLGVTAGAEYGIDRIAATYLFMREAPAGGQCVLYRPLHTRPLMQFCSLDALWEEMSAPGELQDETLRWMTELAQSRYSHGGFRAPRVVRFGLGDEFAPLPHSAPARPALVPLPSPRLHALYREVVEAVIAAAERHSVSNAENRWVSLGQLAEALFTSVLPVLSGPLATAGWLVQLSEAFDAYLQAQGTHGGASGAAGTNLLFTIVTLLLSEAAHWPVEEHPGAGEGEVGQPEPRPGEDADAARPTELPHLPDALEGKPVPALGWLSTAAPETHTLSRPLDLDLGWSSVSLAPTPAQTEALARLRASPPGHGASAIPHGPNQGLYLVDNRWLVRWQHDYFAVSFEEVDPRIVGPDGTPGPYLRRDEAGRWVLDLRLRLRGGGPKRRIEARRRQNEQDREQGDRLFAEIMTTFEGLRDRANPLAERVDLASQRNEPAIALREELDEMLRAGHEHGAQIILLYETLNKVTPLPDFSERICTILSRQLHISKTITDNLSELSRVYLESTPYLGISDKALRETVRANPQQWYSFLARYQELTEHSLTFVRLHHKTRQHLEAFPGLGVKKLEENQSAVDTLHSVLDLQASLAYCELGLLLEPLRDTPALAKQVQTAFEPLLIHSTSHADLVDDVNLPEPVKMQVLDTAIRQYQRVEDALRRYRVILTAEQKDPALDRFEVLALDLRADAEQRLGDLVRTTTTVAGPSTASRRPTERRKPRPRPKPGGSGQSSSANASLPAGSPGEESGAEAPSGPEVIHTEDGESVMVHTRTDERSHARVAEVISNGAVLATWQQHPETGVWAKPRTQVQVPGKAEGFRLGALVHNADRAMAQARREIKQVARFKQATRIPVDIEDQYHFSAARLEELAEGIEEALTRVNATDAQTPQHGSAELKARELRDLAASARQLGTQARIDLSKSLLPTAGRLAFLVEQGEASIRKLGARTPLGRGGRRDFVQEYEIRDRQQHVLWYAHFHYDTASASAERFTAAHLKTVTQRFDGYEKQLQQARNNEEVIGIYRSRIDLALARQLFLSLH